MAQLGACPTGDQEVEGSIPARSGNILSWIGANFFLLEDLFQKGDKQF